jgi:hypothetical protein
MVVGFSTACEKLTGTSNVDRHDIAEILLEVASNTTSLTFTHVFFPIYIK